LVRTLLMCVWNCKLVMDKRTADTLQQSYFRGSNGWLGLWSAKSRPFLHVALETI
jgi:hypothetical protein